jgi:hypothetical protein
MSENVTYEGVTYYPVKNLAPLTTGVETCPDCGGEGEMYGRDCKTCKGKGLVFPPLPPTTSLTTGNKRSYSTK